MPSAPRFVARPVSGLVSGFPRPGRLPVLLAQWLRDPT